MAQRTPVGGPILSGAGFLYLEECYRPVVVRVRLKESADPCRLQRAVDRALRIHPWAAWGIYRTAGAFRYHDGLPKSIRVTEADREELPPLGGARAEGRLTGVYFKGNELTIPFFHGLTDGRGIFSFIEEILRGYQGARPESAGAAEGMNAEPFEAAPPGAAAPGDVNAEPFEAARALFDRLHPEEAVPGESGGDSGKAGDASDDAGAAKSASFFVPGWPGSASARPCHRMIRAKSDDLLRLAKSCGVRPAALFVSLLAKAFRQVPGASEAPFRIAVPADFRRVLEIPHTFRNCAVPPLTFDLDPETLQGDFRALAAAVQRRISAMTEKAAAVRAVRALAESLAPLSALPYGEGAALFARLAGGPQFTLNLSCTYRAPREPFVSLLDAVYIDYPSPPGRMAVQIVSLPDCFCICLSQGDSSPVWEAAVCRELRKNGVSFEQDGVLTGNPGTIELREYEKFEQEGGGPA